MACLIIVETSPNAKAHVVRRRIFFALTRSGCMYVLVLQEIRIHLKGLLTACKTNLKMTARSLSAPAPQNIFQLGWVRNLLAQIQRRYQIHQMALHQLFGSGSVFLR